MNHCFKFAFNFTGKGLQHFDTSRVTNMWNMFSSASKFNGEIGGWNTGRVTNMVRANRTYCTVYTESASHEAIFTCRSKKSMFQDAVRFDQDVRYDER
jgi:surface protein